MGVSGPMFEPAETALWKSIHNKEGGHYNNYGCKDADGMDALLKMFPDGKADDMNFVLFSTSGIHGTYGTIEEIGKKDEDGYTPTDVTFLIVQPRICTVRHGNATPRNPDELQFLKDLRESSWRVVQKIGRHNP